MKRIFSLRTLAVISAIGLLGFIGLIAMKYLPPANQAAAPVAAAPSKITTPLPKPTPASAVVKDKKQTGSDQSRDKKPKTPEKKKTPA